MDSLRRPAARASASRTTTALDGGPASALRRLAAKLAQPSTSTSPGREERLKQSAAARLLETATSQQQQQQASTHRCAMLSDNNKPRPHTVRSSAVGSSSVVQTRFYSQSSSSPNDVKKRPHEKQPNPSERPNNGRVVADEDDFDDEYDTLPAHIRQERLSAEMGEAFAGDHTADNERSPSLPIRGSYEPFCRSEPSDSLRLSRGSATSASKRPKNRNDDDQSSSYLTGTKSKKSLRDRMDEEFRALVQSMAINDSVLTLTVPRYRKEVFAAAEFAEEIDESMDELTDENKSTHRHHERELSTFKMLVRECGENELSALFQYLILRLWFCEDHTVDVDAIEDAQGEEDDADNKSQRPQYQKVSFPAWEDGQTGAFDVERFLRAVIETAELQKAAQGSTADAEGTWKAVTPFDPTLMKKQEPDSSSCSSDDGDSPRGSTRRRRLSNKLGTLQLPVIYEKRRTGYESTKSFEIVQNDVVAGRYRLGAILGEATFSRAVRCEDLHKPVHPPHTPEEDQEYETVCLKVVNNSKEFFDQALDEVKLLTMINAAAEKRFQAAEDLLHRDSLEQQARVDAGEEEVAPSREVVRAAQMVERYTNGSDALHVLQFVDYFYFKEHMFLVCELLADNLYEYAKYNRRHEANFYFTIDRIQRIALQVTEALEFIHSLGLLHCDLKPENILFRSYSRCEIKVIDFGSSCFDTDQLSSYIQSRSYRAPEVLLGANYDGRIDVWSLGCILVELITGDVLFHSNSIAEMVARIVATCGPIPTRLLHESRHADCVFTRDGVIYSAEPTSDDQRYEQYVEGQKPFCAVRDAFASHVNEMYEEAEKARRKKNKKEEQIMAVLEANLAVDPVQEASEIDQSQEQSITIHLPVPPTRPRKTSRSRSRSNSPSSSSSSSSSRGDSDGHQPPSTGDRIVDAIRTSAPPGYLESAPEQTVNNMLGFIRMCIRVDPTERPTAAELLDHPFLAAPSSNQDE